MRVTKDGNSEILGESKVEIVENSTFLLFFFYFSRRILFP